MKSAGKWQFMTKVSISSLLILRFALSAFAAEPSKVAGDTPEARRATKALNLLEVQGFGGTIEERRRNSFQDFRQLDNNFAATILQNGRTFTVVVDPETGQVTRKD
jgi:hypothetical protein